MDSKIDLSKGGNCVVVYETTGFVQEYSTNPQVDFLKCSEVDTGNLNTRITKDTKVIILAEGVPKFHYMWITSWANRNKCPFLIRNSNQAIYEALKSFFVDGMTLIKPSNEEINSESNHGKLKQLIPLIDFTKSNVENARILLRECYRLNIKSTEGSLAQMVSIHRRKQSGTALPKSTRSKLDVSVDMLDSMIKELGDMRDYLIQTNEENRILKSKLDRFKKAMEE